MIVERTATTDRFIFCYRGHCAKEIVPGSYKTKWEVSFAQLETRRNIRSIISQLALALH